MIPLLLSSLLTVFLLTTFGVFISRYSTIQFSIFEKLLLGLVTCNTLTTYLSLFFPINAYILLVFIFTGLILLVITRKDLRAHISTGYRKRHILFAALPFILVSFTLALSFPDSYDAGLYHIQSIKWIAEYPVVPGLANLHGRFGFNPNIFTFFTLTSIPDLFNHETFAINLTVLSILVVYFINRLHSIFEENGFSNLFIFYFFLFIIILRLPNLSSPSPDFLSTVIPLFIFVRILDISYQNTNSEFRSFIPVLILGIYILTVKLASLAILFLFIYIFIKYKSEIQKSIRIFPLFFLIIAPWLIRTIILTGWLVYPFPSLDLFNFDWEVPLEYVIDEKVGITGWARNPGPEYALAAKMHFTDWVPLWWGKTSNSYKVFFTISLLFPMIILIGQKINLFKVNYFTNAVIISAGVGVLFWFSLAPDWRFGEPFIIVASLSPLLVFAPCDKLKPSLNCAFTILIIALFGYYTLDRAFILIAIFSPLLYFKSYLNPAYQSKIILGVILMFFLGTGIKRNFSKIKNNCTSALLPNNLTTPPKISVSPTLGYKTYQVSTIDIFIPTEGDRCFDHKIPCTPYPDSLLVLRGTTLNSGFKYNKPS